MNPETKQENAMKLQKTIALTFVFAFTAPAQIPDFTPETPLIEALMHNDHDNAMQLIEQGANPNEGHFFGFSPLMLAIIRQDVDLVRLMVAKGADLNALEPSGSTALMWAASSETGDARMVEALLEMGADPLATNKAGEDALSWALRRGETPAAAALRKAGASDRATMRESVEKAIGLLQKSGSQFLRVSGCASCHHQFLPMMAQAAARSKGVAVDEAVARVHVDASVAIMKSVAAEAVQNRDRIPDPPIGISYSLLSLAAEGYPADETTSAMAQVVAAWQGADGAFYTIPAIRPPIEASHFTSTALSLRAVQLYGKDPEERVARAMNWLLAAEPRTNEDRAMQLLGLAWAKAPGHELRGVANALLAEQRPDGGWGQLAALESDAYATGQALVALQTAGHPVTSIAYRRGASFLMRTQFPDGSWLARTRTFPVQPLKESGFPHGKHQWISAAGTSWAAMALALALPD